jgi:hypothetical protein
MGFKGPGDGSGRTGTGVNRIDPDQQQDATQNPNSQGQESKSPQATLPSEPPKMVKVFVGRQGVSEDQVTWFDGDQEGQFAEFLQQLKDKGIKEVHYLLLPDSIERFEEMWKEELIKAKLTYAELQNDTDTN